MSAECYELSTPIDFKSSHVPLARDFLATNSRLRDGLCTKGSTIMYRVIAVAFCFAIVFVGLLLIMARVDTLTGYQLICLTPQG